MADLVFVDVSHWQVEEDRLHHRLMDWEEAVAGGLTGVVVKYTQGEEGVDPAAMLHAWSAYQARVPMLGAYHFGDGGDGVEQARHFLDVVRRDYGGSLDGVMLMLDAERNAASQMTVGEAERFVQTIKGEVGRWPWVYMGRDGPTGDRQGLPNAVLSQCPLLLPKYGPEPTAANLPSGFAMPTDATTRAGVCRAWQFTDGTIHGGPFPGLGRVDQSKFVGVSTVDEAKALWAS